MEIKEKDDLSGKVILVTGGARGLGAAAALAFAESGAKVVVLDVEEPDHAGLPADAAAHIGYLRHDVSDPASWTRVVASVLRDHGRIDGLLNNAGIFKSCDLADTTVELMDRIYRVNQLGVFLGMQAVLEPMKKAGGGVIVNLASIVGQRGFPGMFAYATSKWAVRGMTRCAAREFAPFGIRVVSVSPGSIETDMLKSHTAEEQAHILSTIPIGRYGKPEDIGRLMRFLMSDEASYITGSEITIDGAMMA